MAAQKKVPAEASTFPIVEILVLVIIQLQEAVLNHRRTIF
jgi:hypothetical protein